MHVFVGIGAMLAMLAGTCISYWSYTKGDMFIDNKIEVVISKLSFGLGITLFLIGTMILIVHP